MISDGRSCYVLFVLARLGGATEQRAQDRVEQVRPSHFRDDWAAVWISLLLVCVVAGQNVSSNDPLYGNDLIALKRGFVDLSHRGQRVPLIAEAI